VLALAAFAAFAIPAPAAEQITLSNGFSMLCHHHATVEGKVRLYLAADETSYIDRLPGDIARIDLVPDPPPEPSQPTADEKANPSDLHEILADAGRAHNIDVDLLASVVKAESNFNSHAVSRVGAQGLMQLMPATANDLGVHDSFQPGENVQGGSAYLDLLLTKYHEDLALALAAYNAGPAAVDKYHGIPPYRETRLYVARVIREFNRRVLARASEAAQSATRTQGTK
jgi:soluble lytic murein transglycosylase-like protein